MKLSAELISFGDFFAGRVQERGGTITNHRKANALELIADCKQYLSSNVLSVELQECIEALKVQDTSVTTLEAIEILLDYAEREMRAVKDLEKGERNYLLNLAVWFKNLFFEKK